MICYSSNTTELQLNECSIKMSKLQVELVEILKKAGGPLSVPEIAVKLKTTGSTPHKTSLYRNIEKLIAEGSVEEVLLDTASVYYEVKREHHHHVLCKICHDVSCIAHDVFEKSMTYLENAARKNGFASLEHHVILRGTCLTCRGV